MGRHQGAPLSPFPAELNLPRGFFVASHFHIFTISIVEKWALLLTFFVPVNSKSIVSLLLLSCKIPLVIFEELASF